MTWKTCRDLLFDTPGVITERSIWHNGLYTSIFSRTSSSALNLYCNSVIQEQEMYTWLYLNDYYTILQSMLLSVPILLLLFDAITVTLSWIASMNLSLSGSWLPKVWPSVHLQTIRQVVQSWMRTLSAGLLRTPSVLLAWGSEQRFERLLNISGEKKHSSFQAYGPGNKRNSTLSTLCT